MHTQWHTYTILHTYTQIYTILYTYTFITLYTCIRIHNTTYVHTCIYTHIQYYIHIWYINIHIYSNLRLITLTLRFYIFFQCLSYLLLKAFTDSASTTYWGNSFHLLTTLWLKKFLLISNLNITFVFLNLCPLVLLWPANLKNSCLVNIVKIFH